MPRERKLAVQLSQRMSIYWRREDLHDKCTRQLSICLHKLFLSEAETVQMQPSWAHNRSTRKHDVLEPLVPTIRTEAGQQIAAC